MSGRSLLGETAELPVLGGLRYLTRGADAARARLAVVLCHGYASTADDLLPIARAAFEVQPELASVIRFYFPAGVVDLGDPVRAWWPVGDHKEVLDRKEYAVVREEVQQGSSGARRAFTPFLDAVQREIPRVVVGGFSQGGLLSVDTALRLTASPAGLIIMSSMIMTESKWRELAPTRAHMPVLITHGTEDPLIDLAEAKRLASLLEGAGLSVSFHSFSGGHTVDVSSATAIAGWLRGLLS